MKYSVLYLLDIILLIGIVFALNKKAIVCQPLLFKFDNYADADVPAHYNHENQLLIFALHCTQPLHRRKQLLSPKDC